MQTRIRQAEDAWAPYSEPLRDTLVRTFAIAAAVATVLSLSGGMAWPVAFLGVLWFSFGGHWVELFFLNVLRPRLPRRRPVQMGVRLLVWFGGGVLLASGAAFMLRLLGRDYVPGVVCWIGGPAFVLVECIAHAALARRNKPNFWRGDG